MRNAYGVKQFPLLLLLTILAFVLVGFPGCETQSTYQKSYTALSGTKATIEGLGKMANDLHARGVLTDEQKTNIDDAYRAAQGAHNALVDAQSEAVMHSGDVAKQEAAAQLSITYLGVVTKFINLAIEYGIARESHKGT